MPAGISYPRLRRTSATYSIRTFGGSAWDVRFGGHLLHQEFGDVRTPENSAKPRLSAPEDGRHRRVDDEVRVEAWRSLRRIWAALLLGGQADIERSDVSDKLLRARRAHENRRDAGPPRDSGERHLRHRPANHFRHGPQHAHHREAGFR